MKIKLILGITFALIVFCVVLSLQWESIFNEKQAHKKRYLLQELNDYEIYALSRGLTLSREYQVKLAKHNFTNREQGINEFLSQLQTIFNNSQLRKKGEETIRYQYMVDTSKCRKNYNLRYRTYVSGFQSNLTTVDAKTVIDKRDNPLIVIDNALKPAEKYKNEAIEKLEWDIHPCKSKLSTETRIQVEKDVELKQCSDLIQLFPQIQGAINPELYNQTLQIAVGHEAYWWELEHHGILRDGITEFKTAITMQYATYRAAVAGDTTPIFSPEWSIRIWSTQGGRNRWVNQTITETDNFYANFLDLFGSTELPC